MRIQTVHIQRFRSIYEAELHCDSLTALVGANGAGKSSFLRAIDIFYQAMALIENHDFYNADTTKPIHITITYTDLSSAEKDAFANFIQADNLTIQKQITANENGKFIQRYYGYNKQHRPFANLRNLDSALAKGAEYKKLREQKGIYNDLPDMRNDQQRLEALIEWEQNHPEHCDYILREYPFLANKSENPTKLERFSNFLLIPAIRDVSADTIDERGSVISRLIDMVVRRLIAEDPEIHQLQQQVQESMRQVVSRTDLQHLNQQLNTTMLHFTPNTQIAINWMDTSTMFKIPLPQVNIAISEDGYSTPINRTGHGVQRSFIITLLQHLAMTNIENKSISSDSTVQGANENIESINPNLILAIEEPELFQHPPRQRHFANILSDLAHGRIPGVAENTQIIYCTHSPFFVNIDRFEQIRVIKKQIGILVDMPKQTNVSSATLQNILKTNSKMDRSRIASILTPAINEGFFARVAVLVEGEGERALLQAFARYCFYGTLDSFGVSIITVSGVKDIFKPLIIFSRLNIKTYSIWDNDKNKENTQSHKDITQRNRELLALCNSPEAEEDWPDGIYSNYTVFGPNMDTVLKSEVTDAGINWDTLLDECLVAIGNKRVKSHPVVWYIVEQAAQQGCTFPTIRRILDQIIALAQD